MIRLIVKGTREEVLAAARSHGLEVDWQHATRFGEQVLLTTADPAPDAVGNWFNEGGWRSPPPGGYPPGALLWYRMPRSVPLTLA